MINIPTTTELYTAILADIQATYGDNIPTFGKNFLRAFAWVQAGKLKLYYLAIGNLQKNIFIDTADPEASGGTLERFGRVKLGRDPFPAQAGQYTIAVTGTIGSTIPASQTFKSDDDSLSPGKLYVLDIAYVLVATTDSITVRALEAGEDSKLEVGDGMTATAPIAGVNAPATVTVEVIAPLAAETIEDYRTNGLEAYRLEPQGGAATDYRLWAADAQGVEQVYPYAKTGAANEINIYVEATVTDSTDGKGTPSAALLTRVQEVVEFDPDLSKPQTERGRRPLGVFDVHYLPVTIRQVDIVIDSFVNNTPAIQASIYAAIQEVVNAIRPFIAAADILAEQNDTLDVNKVIATILVAKPGSSFGTVTLKIDGVSEATHTFVNGDIPYFATVTYT